jgi:hypothetical protein
MIKPHTKKVVHPCPKKKAHKFRIPVSALLFALPLLVQPSHFGLPESMLWVAPGALWLGIEIGWLLGHRHVSLGWYTAIEASCVLLEKQRQEVVDNDQDPSWTEHFLAVEQGLRGLEQPSKDATVNLLAQISTLTAEVRTLKAQLEQVGAENGTLAKAYRKLRKAHSKKGFESNGRDRANMGA